MCTFDEYNEELMNIEFDIDELANANDIYLRGKCHIFALALKEVSSLPLASITDFDEDIQKTCLTHAFVQSDDGIIDIKGLRDISSVYDDFDTFDPECMYIKDCDLLKLGEGRKTLTNKIKQDIKDAIPLAEKVYGYALRQIEISQLLENSQRLIENRNF